MGPRRAHHASDVRCCDPSTPYVRAIVSVVTSANDILLVAFKALSDGVQKQFFQRLREARLSSIEAEDSETARHLVSLRRVCEHLGRVPNVREYKRVTDELGKAGGTLTSQTTMIRFFGTWMLALEALELSDDETGLAIEARFQKRLLGRPAEYTQETLRATLAECVEVLGRIPTLSEFNAWRRRKTELAREAGEVIWIPGDSSYRRQHGSWEKALLHFGYDPEAVAARLDPGMRARTDALLAHRFQPSQP